MQLLVAQGCVLAVPQEHSAADPSLWGVWGHCFTWWGGLWVNKEIRWSPTAAERSEQRLSCRDRFSPCPNLLSTHHLSQWQQCCIPWAGWMSWLRAGSPAPGCNECPGGTWVTCCSSLGVTLGNALVQQNWMRGWCFQRGNFRSPTELRDPVCCSRSSGLCAPFVLSSLQSSALNPSLLLPRPGLGRGDPAACSGSFSSRWCNGAQVV